MHTRQEFKERAGCWLGNHLIADHPEIKAHLATRVAASKITMIPYGADRIDNPDSGVPAQYGLQPGGYAMVQVKGEGRRVDLRERCGSFLTASYRT
jgi:hypothetical protein